MTRVFPGQECCHTGTLTYQLQHSTFLDVWFLSGLSSWLQLEETIFIICPDDHVVGLMLDYIMMLINPITFHTRIHVYTVAWNSMTNGLVLVQGPGFGDPCLGVYKH